MRLQMDFIADIADFSFLLKFQISWNRHAFLTNNQICPLKIYEIRFMKNAPKIQVPRLTKLIQIKDGASKYNDNNNNHS